MTPANLRPTPGKGKPAGETKLPFSGQLNSIPAMTTEANMHPETGGTCRADVPAIHGGVSEGEALRKEHPAFGIWREREPDSLTLQEALRAEWQS